MAIVAPYVRKHLSADALFRLVHSGFASLPEHRPEDAEISFTDALMSAFAMFSLKAPSLLAFDKERAEGNVHTIYGIARVPCDTHMRQILDPVSPKVFRPVFTSVFRQLQRGKALEPLVFLDGHYLLALDGTAYFSSQTMHCASCLQKVHRNGAITYCHHLMVLLEGPVDSAQEIRRIWAVLYPLQLESDRLLSVVPVDVALYNRGEYALYRQAQAEGGPL